MQRINNLQAVRAFAALFVTFFHTGYPVLNRQVGDFGLDAFFCLSGFLMAAICVQAPQQFFLRRLIRIVPLYWTLTLVVFIAAKFLPAAFHSTEHATVVELMKSLFFIPYDKEAGRIQPVLFLGWTLEYEMYFYVAIAVALKLVPRRLAPIAGSVLIGVVYLLCRRLSLGPITRFYGRPIVFEFVFGIAAYFLSERIRRMPMLVAAAGALLSAAALVSFNVLRVETGSNQLLAYGVPAALLVLSCVLLARTFDTQSTLLIAIGDASYMLYLSHMFVVSAFLKAAHRFAPHAVLGTAVVSVAVATGAAVILYQCFERPVLRYLNRITRPQEKPVIRGSPDKDQIDVRERALTVRVPS